MASGTPSSAASAASSSSASPAAVGACASSSSRASGGDKGVTSRASFQAGLRGGWPPRMAAIRSTLGIAARRAIAPSTACSARSQGTSRSSSTRRTRSSSSSGSSSSQPSGLGGSAMAARTAVSSASASAALSSATKARRSPNRSTTSGWQAASSASVVLPMPAGPWSTIGSGGSCSRASTICAVGSPRPKQRGGGEGRDHCRGRTAGSSGGRRRARVLELLDDAADLRGDRGQGHVVVRPVDQRLEVVLLVLRHALQMGDRQGAQIDVVAHDRHDPSCLPLGPVERDQQLLQPAIGRADEVGRDQHDDEVGLAELALDAGVPRLAGLELAIVEMLEPAAVAQPAQMLEHPIAPPVVLVRVGEKRTDRPGLGHGCHPPRRA